MSSWKTQQHLAAEMWASHWFDARGMTYLSARAKLLDIMAMPGRLKHIVLCLI